MISNNTAYRPRAIRSSRDVQDFENANSDENAENSPDDDLEEDEEEGNNRRGLFPKEPHHSRIVGRSRSSEFRPSKATERRGYRGRAFGGPPSSRRIDRDRDYSDNFYPLRKYESRNADSGYYYRGKFYELEKKAEIKLPEDTRISKLLRRLNIETDQDNSLATSKKLLEVLLLPDNAYYVRKAFHIIGESAYDILHVSPGPLAKVQVAKALGRMGYIMGQENDFERYQHWLFNKMGSCSSEEIQILLMRSVKETLDLEAQKPILSTHIENLINSLVMAMERTENADVFKAILDILVMVVEMYPAEFHDQFRDAIDLLFGWHVDHTQPLAIIEFISKSMQKISNHFKYHLDFSVQLIENFLEDIVNYASQLNEVNNIEHVTLLILAMNSVLKCLGSSFHPMNNKNVKPEFINNAITKIIKTVKDALELFIPDNLLIAGNDCIGVLLGYFDTKPHSLSNALYQLIDLEISLVGDLTDAGIISLLVLISKVIKELSANLPIELIEKLIGPKSELVKLRYSPFKNMQHAVISVYQALLNLKNVSLLQEAYRYVLGDLEITYKHIVPSIEPFTPNNPFADYVPESVEETVLFLLRCLSQLSNASSIIVMWALKPSILELIGIDLKPHDSNLAKMAPSLQYCLLYLLFSHCKCYNHFISNSTLVNNKQEAPNLLNRFALTEGLNINDVHNTSPNSGNFATILEIIYKALSTESSCEVTLLLLQWLNDILINSENYLENLYQNENFLKLAGTLVRCGYHFKVEIVLAVYENLDKLLSNKQLSWGNVFLINVSDLCKLHMDSCNADVRECYTKLSSNIPWDIAISELNKVSTFYALKRKSTNLSDYNNYMVYLAQHLHLNGNVDSEIYPLQFKTFMKYLLNNDPQINGWLEDIFTCCWAVQSDSQMNMELFYDLAVNSRQVLNNWITLEAAQFCVNYKLRTPLGKPNETFMKIEGALNQLGNELILMKKSQGNPSGDTSDGKRVRLLLKFIEHLEKCIYNASEGCAMAMSSPTKVVRSFFIANTNTCHEWFNRIRLVVMHIALHAGEVNIALRNGQCLLKDFVAQGKANTLEFERVAMIVTLAYLNLKESEALHGLYVWCKNMAGKRYSWIKCAAEQASKKYETAAEGYKKILQEKGDANLEDDHKKLDADIQNFITDQIIICYKELSNWVDLFEWKNQQGTSENGRKYWFNMTDWDCNKVLYSIDSENFAFCELNTWDFKNEANSWSVYENLALTESSLYNVALKVASKKEQDYTPVINANLSHIQKSIQDYLHLAPSEFLQNYSLLHYVANGLCHIAQDNPAHTTFLVSENFENEIHKIDSGILRKILWWSEHFGKVQNQGFNVFCSNLRLDLIKRARKERNFKTAANYLNRFFHDKDMTVPKDANLNMITCFFLENISDFNVWTVDTAKGILELIKFSYSLGHNHQQTFNLCAAASTAISKYAESFRLTELRKISSKILLKLSNWLQMNENISLTEMNSPLGKLIMVLPEIGTEHVSPSIVPMNEIAIGKLLHFSVHHCRILAKNWNAFGTWCYRWGKKIVDHSSDIKNNLSEEHCLQIKELLPADTPEEDLTKIFLILSQTRSIIDEEDIDSNEIKTSEMIQKQLQCVGVLEDATEEQLLNLVQIWRSTQKRIYDYYTLSADAYFKYLHLVMQSENMTGNTECNTITITLRLLRLIVKYALELQSTLEEGLKTTPTQPWKVIIPQLFSRLNHPESYVRHRVSDLLCRVAEDAPHLITFPAVVGALEGGLQFDFSEMALPKDCLSQDNECHDGDENELNEEDDTNYDSDNETEDTTNTLKTCFKTMVDTLSKQDPETISQVQTLVQELRRITLLWDELWLGTLAQHQSEITKRQQQLQYEIEKVNDNTSLSKEQKVSLIAEKHRIIVKPIIFILEQLLDVTSIEAETPHEKQFQEKYLENIREVIIKLKNPEDPGNPVESLQPLKSLQKKFQQKFHKRQSYSLKMQDISPTLHSLKNTVITMPGLATTAKKNITISHVSNVVSILPTKTKPKKLVFYGSDGQTYTYLFKGLEDLHLDERIMQFLSITNTMMAQNTDPSGHNFYQARHYSVIPLGPRSGLISWVDGTTPVFALYKRWQQRELAKPNSKTSITSAQSVLRPSELFYNKLNPLLQEHGVKNVDNRKEWPLSVLKQVLSELMKETPSDLLAKEFWCNSISADMWWQVTKRYSYSVAVMSMIGYIIGLGDRHLDNVLVDLSSGDVVHIDYNVCFEKGKTLRVPEKVPFRLTPNMMGALGVTGIEGIFRLACENALKTMRKGRETLLTLLEAFVYDPLIDWTVGGEVLAGTTFGGLATDNTTRQSKKDLEKEVTLSMFNVRCTEMRAEWNENMEEILGEVPALLSHLNSYLKTNVAIARTEDALQDLHQQLALIKEAEAQGVNNHSLYSLPAHYDAYHKSQDAMTTARKDLDNFVADCENHIEIYKNLLGLHEKQQFSQWILELQGGKTEDSMQVFDLVREFLHNAGKDDFIAECEQSEQEMFQISQHLNVSIRKCLQVYHDYFAVMSQCPKGYIEYHRIHLYLKWTKYLLEVRKQNSCEVVYDKIREFMENLKMVNNPHIINVAYSLETLYKENIIQVNKLYEELTAIRARDSNHSPEKMYSSAKAGINNFLSSEKGSTSGLEFVLASELVLLNRHFLTLEVAAQRSGDWLIKLTSREGDWFLDDLLLQSSRAVEMIGNLPQRVEDVQFLKVLKGIRIANGIYKGLYDLNFNFHTIILPESMKKIQAEEASVLQLIYDLNKVILDIGVPIPEIIVQLEKLLTCVLMQMDVNSTYDFILDRVAFAKKQFLILIPSQAESLSQGKMLVMGFNGLFDKLSQEIHNLVETLGDVDIPKSWKKLDHVKEARNIAPPIFNPRVRDILEDIFFLKRIKTISEFFALAQDMCQTLKGVGTGIVFNDEQLTKPVKQFIAEFISRQLLGITPETITYAVCFLLQNLGLDVTHEIEQKDIGAESKVPLDELYTKAWSYLLKHGTFSQNVLSQASSLEANLKLAWEKIQEPKKLEQKLTVLQSTTIRLQNQLTIHNLMFDEVLLLNNFASVRAKFIVDIRNEVTALQTIYRQLIDSKAKQQKLIEKAFQRLNWAKGANPNVGEISTAFENAIDTRNNRLNFEQKVANNILSTYNVILQHELLRNSSVETAEHDKRFLKCFEKWRLSCQYIDSKNDSLLPAEESILNMLSPDLVNDPNWLQKLSENLTDSISTMQKKLKEHRLTSFADKDALTSLMENFKTVYNIHCRLMSDVKSLIKNMMKIDEYSLATQHFVQDYRHYVENFSMLFSKFKKEMAIAEIGEQIGHVEYIRDNTRNLYEALIDLETTKNRSSTLKRQGAIDGDKKLPQKQESLTKGQQRNAYAVNVWRRVKMKLEGRDPDPGRKCTVQEQVDHVIREATNMDNLALLYEGWTPWV